MLRYIFGMLLVHMVFAAKQNRRRALNYSVFWLVLNVILLN